MDIKLNKNEYNFVFGFLSQGLSGHAGSAVVAHKLIEQIQGKANEGKAESLELEVELYELEQIVEGIVHLVKTGDKVSAAAIAELLLIASLLKIKKAAEKKILELVPKDKNAEIDSDLELDTEPAVEAVVG